MAARNRRQVHASLNGARLVLRAGTDCAQLSGRLFNRPLNGKILKHFARSALAKATGLAARTERTWRPKGGLHDAGKFARSSQKTTPRRLRLRRFGAGCREPFRARRGNPETEEVSAVLRRPWRRQRNAKEPSSRRLKRSNRRSGRIPTNSFTGLRLSDYAGNCSSNRGKRSWPRPIFARLSRSRAT